MARLFAGEKETRTRQVHRVLGRYWMGLSEAEIAQELGWDRRTLNNYLRALERQGQAYKEGRNWFADQ